MKLPMQENKELQHRNHLKKKNTRETGGEGVGGGRVGVGAEFEWGWLKPVLLVRILALYSIHSYVQTYVLSHHENCI